MALVAKQYLMATLPCRGTMDPRHPELAIGRIDELVGQFKQIIDKLGYETVSSRLAATEREGALVVQEICLVAPRLHEAMMQASRNRRHDLARGNVYEQFREYAATRELVEEPEEELTFEQQAKQKAKRKTAKKKKVE